MGCLVALCPDYRSHMCFKGNQWLGYSARSQIRRGWSPPLLTSVIAHIGCLDLMDRECHLRSLLSA